MYPALSDQFPAIIIIIIIMNIYITSTSKLGTLYSQPAANNTHTHTHTHTGSLTHTLIHTYIHTDTHTHTHLQVHQFSGFWSANCTYRSHYLLLRS